MVSPSYTLYILYCVQKTTVYFDFHKQKSPASCAVAYYNPHIKGANIYFSNILVNALSVAICYDLLQSVK